MILERELTNSSKDLWRIILFLSLSLSHAFNRLVQLCSLARHRHLKISSGMNLSLNLAPNPSLSLSLSLSIYLHIHIIRGSSGSTNSSHPRTVQEDIEHFGDVGSLDDNMDSFLSHDGGEGRDLYGTLKPGLTEHKTESSKGFSFGEVGCIRTRNKVTCCHFSSDGKLLASAGHDKKVVLWSMDTLKTEITPEEHQYLITDVRFRPNSSQLATASFDKSLRL
ncbi:unnamed protein product [Camellia sinensis]